MYILHKAVQWSAGNLQTSLATCNIQDRSAATCVFPDLLGFPHNMDCYERHPDMICVKQVCNPRHDDFKKTHITSASSWLRSKYHN